MGAVGGSRHYQGGGLGPEPLWACPSCGEDNTGPLAEGCANCGAGRPGRHIGTPPRDGTRTDAPPVPPAPTVQLPPPEEAYATPGQRWLVEHPGATPDEAFNAGYLEGIKAARRAQAAAAQQAPRPPEPERLLAPNQIVNRTIVAALELFRDHVLSASPDEVTTGEWLSAQQVTQLIREIQGEVVARA